MGHSFSDGPSDWWLAFLMPGLETINFVWVPILSPESGGQSNRTQSEKDK